MLKAIFDEALRGDIRAASTIFGTTIKLGVDAPEQNGPDGALSDDDNEIVADFLRRNLPSDSSK